MRKVIVFEKNQRNDNQLQFRLQNALFNYGYLWASDVKKKEKKYRYYSATAYILYEEIKSISYYSYIDGIPYKNEIEYLREKFGKENMILVKDYLNNYKFYNASCMDTE